MDNYQETSYIGEMDITAEQHAKLLAFGKFPELHGFDKYFKGWSNSCVDFTWKALEVAGLNPDQFEGDMWPVNNADNFKDIGFSPVLTRDNLFADKLFNEQFKYVKDVFSEAQNAGSPLVLDLDGDGVEVSALAYGAAGSHVYFDMDNDGFAERTAWTTGGDGLLALDKNGNGKIDNQSAIWPQTYSNNNAEFGKSQAA